MSSRNHVLQVPTVVLGLRVVQLVTAIAILGLAAYGIEYLSFDGDNLSLFTALASMIIVVYYLVATIATPVMYNYWAILGLDIFAVVFWIISFSLLASEVASYEILTYNYTPDDSCLYVVDGVCYKKRSLNFLSKRATTSPYTYKNAMAAASGLGGLEFLLFAATLAITGVFLHRHRAAGGHCMPAGAVGAGNVIDESKPTDVNGQQEVYQQQPAIYQQQPVQQEVYQQQPQQENYQQQPVQQEVYQQQPQQEFYQQQPVQEAYQQQPVEPIYQQQPVIYAAQQDQQIASA